jgi:hypothetical protein
MLRGKNGHGRSAFALESLENRKLLTAVTALDGINPGGPMIPANPVVQPIDVINPGGPIIVSNPVKTQGELVHPVVDTEFNGELGTISGVSGVASNLSNLHGQINWGDGHTSSATFSQDSNGIIEVDGSHEYSKTGEFHININVYRSAVATPGKPIPLYVMELGTIHATSQVRQNSTGGVTLDEKAAKSFTATVGTFNYTGSQSLRATIDWGDNNTSTGKLTKGKNGKYTVTGTHTYKNKGDYHIHITVTNGVVVDPPIPVPVDPVANKVPAILIIAQIDSTADVT